MNHFENDVIVVGGGLAGLTTAVTLTRAGHSVTLLEKSRQLGGRATTQQKEGFLFNQGPHALYIQGAGYAILKELGVPISGKKPLTVKKSWGMLNGRFHLLPGDPLSILQTDLLDWRGKLAMGAFVVKLMRTDPQAVVGETAVAWLNRHISHPALFKLMDMLGRVATYVQPDERLSAQVLVQQLQFALGKNVLYLDGGWQTIVDGLRDAAVAAGVTLRTEARVTAVAEHPYHATVSLNSGEHLTSQAVVLATSPHHVATLLPKHPQVQRWAETAVPVRAALLDVALNRLPNPNRLLAFGLDAPLYFSTHSHFAKLAPDGHALVHVMRNLAPDESGQACRAELEAFLDEVQPGWHNEAVHSRFLPEMTVTPWLALAQDGGLDGRPPLQIPDHTRLFQAGDWVGPTGWLADAAFTSGKAVAALVSKLNFENVNSGLFVHV